MTVDLDAPRWRHLFPVVAAAGLNTPSELVDDETGEHAVELIREAYAQAAALAWPRVRARLLSARSLTAAGGGGDQTLPDIDWANIVNVTIGDAIGDAVLDGVIAGGIDVGKMPPDGVVENAVKAPVDDLIEYAPKIRADIDKWIDDQVKAVLDEPVADENGMIGPESRTTPTIEEQQTLWETDSPLSPDKADLVADTELHAAVNAGYHAALGGAVAVQWVTQRDARVRPTHAAALLQTAPPGGSFEIGGYPARFPGDPNLPFAERVNCRCYLSPVSGARPSKVIGSTVAQLRKIATDLKLPGRSKLRRKSELQMALIRHLCLQGLAYGPECPDTIGDMNRVALLTLARTEGIVGRHKMNRDDLIAALRDRLGVTAPEV